MKTPNQILGLKELIINGLSMMMNTHTTLYTAQKIVK
jgi:hypothetical protein